MAFYIFGGIVIGLYLVTQMYSIVAAGNREFELEDSEQEDFIREWKNKHKSH